MQTPIGHFLVVFMAFFAVMNPLANSSLFIGLTDGMERGQQRRLAMRSVLVAFLIVAVFAIGGRALFSVFGITLPAFRVAGGVMIALIGYHLLQGEHTRLHKPSGLEDRNADDAVLDMAITPLGIPILAGPGTIATAMNFAAESSLPEIASVLIAFALICLLTLVAFLGGPWLARTLGDDAIKVVSRLMGLILAVVGAQMLIDGLHGAGFS